MSGHEIDPAAARSGAAPPEQIGNEIALARLYNLIANLAHPRGDHRENALEDEAHDLIRDLRAQFAALAAARLALQQELEQLKRELAQTTMLKEQAQRYHEGVYDLFKRYCPDELRKLPIDASQRTLGATLTKHLGERAEAAEAAVTALRQDLQALPRYEGVTIAELIEGWRTDGDGPWIKASDLADRLARDDSERGHNHGHSQKGTSS